VTRTYDQANFGIEVVIASSRLHQRVIVAGRSIAVMFSEVGCQISETGKPGTSNTFCSREIMGRGGGMGRHSDTSSYFNNLLPGS
jgi:hypothetical protein